VISSENEVRRLKKCVSLITCKTLRTSFAGFEGFAFLGYVLLVLRNQSKELFPYLQIKSLKMLFNASKMPYIGLLVLH
jgi:hypothetical protein